MLNLLFRQHVNDPSAIKIVTTKQRILPTTNSKLHDPNVPVEMKTSSIYKTTESILDIVLEQLIIELSKFHTSSQEQHHGINVPL